MALTAVLRIGYRRARIKAGSPEAISVLFLTSTLSSSLPRSTLQLFSSWPQSSSLLSGTALTFRLYNDLISSSWPLVFPPWAWFCSTLWPHPATASESPSAWSRLGPRPVSHDDPHSWEAGDSSGAWRGLNLSHTIFFKNQFLFQEENDDFLTNWRTMKTV